jgi:hypothetical protein
MVNKGRNFTKSHMPKINLVEICFVGEVIVVSIYSLGYVPRVNTVWREVSVVLTQIRKVPRKPAWFFNSHAIDRNCHRSNIS